MTFTYTARVGDDLRWTDGHAYDPNRFEDYVTNDDGFIVCRDPMTRTGVTYNPNQALSAAQMLASGMAYVGIGCGWRDTPYNVVNVSVQWSGLVDDGVSAGPLIHVTPGTAAHGFMAAPCKLFGVDTILVGTIGNPPELFEVADVGTITHVDGTVRTVELRSDGTGATVWLDGVQVEMLTAGFDPVPIPVELQASLKHGFALDVHRAGLGAAPDLPTFRQWQLNGTIPDPRDQIPATIDQTGVTDVTSAINGWLSGLPSHVTDVELRAGAIYRIDAGAIVIPPTIKTVDFKGVTLKRTTILAQALRHPHITPYVDCRNLTDITLLDGVISGINNNNGDIEVLASSFGTTSSSRVITDAVITGGTTVTSATANFVNGDLGDYISGPGIRAGTIITAKASNPPPGTTQVTISDVATNGSGLTLTVNGAYYLLNAPTNVNGTPKTPTPQLIASPAGQTRGQFGVYCASLAFESGINVNGCRNVTIDGWSMTGVGGDYVNIQIPDITLPTNITVTNLYGRRNGRQGIAVNGADGVTILDFDIWSTRGAIDCEPTNNRIIRNVEIGNGDVKTHLGVLPMAGNGLIENVYIHDVHVIAGGVFLSATDSPAAGGVQPRNNFTVLRCSKDEVQTSPASGTFDIANGNNWLIEDCDFPRDPTRSYRTTVRLLNSYRSTGITVRNNRFPGAFPVVEDQYQLPTLRAQSTWSESGNITGTDPGGTVTVGGSLGVNRDVLKAVGGTLDIGRDVQGTNVVGGELDLGRDVLAPVGGTLDIGRDVQTTTPVTADALFYDSNAFNSRHEIYSADLDGTNSQRHTQSAFNMFRPQPNPVDPTIVMCSSSALGSSPHDDPAFIQHLYIVDTATSIVTLLVDVVADFGGDWIAHPEWHPSGNKFCAMYQEPSTPSRGIVQFNFDQSTRAITGTALLQATLSTSGTNRLRDPSYHPDGTKICYVRVESGQPSLSGVYEIDVSITNQTGRGLNARLVHADTSHTNMYDPFYSPDGSEIAVMRLVAAGPPEQWAIAKFDAATGGSWVYVVNDTEINRNPEWASNTRIYFHRKRTTDPNLGLWAVDSDGSNLDQILLTSSVEEYPVISRPINGTTPAPLVGTAGNTLWYGIDQIDELTDNDFRQIRDDWGVTRITIQLGYVGYGGDQRFTDDTAATFNGADGRTGVQWNYCRKIKYGNNGTGTSGLGNIVDRLHALGIKVYAGIRWRSLLPGSLNPIASWFNDAEWTNNVLDPTWRWGERFAYAQAWGFDGMAADDEILDTNPQQVPMPAWGWGPYGQDREAECRIKVYERGAQFGAMMADIWPDVDWIQYSTTGNGGFPDDYDENVRQVPASGPNAKERFLQRHWWDGIFAEPAWTGNFSLLNVFFRDGFDTLAEANTAIGNNKTTQLARMAMNPNNPFGSEGWKSWSNMAGRFRINPFFWPGHAANIGGSEDHPESLLHIVNEFTAGRAHCADMVGFYIQTLTDDRAYFTNAMDVAIRGYLWRADANVDADDTDSTIHWGDKEISNARAARLVIAADPDTTYGNVYQAHTTPAEMAADPTSNRAEIAEAHIGGVELQLGKANSLGFDTRDIFMGWRSRIGSGVFLHNDSNDGNYMQLKGDASTGGPVLGLSIINDRIKLRSENFLTAYSGVAWTGPLITSISDEWHDYVIHVVFNTNPTVGLLQVWMDGVPQTLSNGLTTIRFETLNPAPTADTYVYPKFGVYSHDVEGAEGASGGPGAYHWFTNVKIGLSYADAAPS